MDRPTWGDFKRQEANQHSSLDAWAIYELDGTGEATGIVHYYDTLEHAQKALSRFCPDTMHVSLFDHPGYSEPELTTEYLPTTQCEWCGCTIEKATEHAL